MTVHSTSHYVTKIADKQQLKPAEVETLKKYPEMAKFIVQHHLHNKITAQHRAEGLGIHFTEGDEPAIMVNKEPVKLAALQVLFGKEKHTEFLADGLEAHHAKNWIRLRPLYEMSERDGKILHIDPSSGELETVGKKGAYIQMMSVSPWGWNPRGGSLFGHSWIRFIVDGKMYHVGGNLSGQILNPDFMASLPMKGKKLSKTKWFPLDETNRDQFGRTQTRRIIQKIEAIQEYILTGSFSDRCPYGEELREKFHELRDQRGGTCTSAAAMTFEEATGSCIREQQGFIEASLFNRTLRGILDFLWRLFPSFFVKNVVRPAQAFTRGAKPQYVAHDPLMH